MKLSKKNCTQVGISTGDQYRDCNRRCVCEKKIVPRWGFQPATNIAIAIVAGEFVRRRYVVVLHDAVNCFEDVSGLVALGWARRGTISYMSPF